MVVGRLCMCCGVKDAWCREIAQVKWDPNDPICLPAQDGQSGVKLFEIEPLPQKDIAAFTTEVDMSIYEIPLDTPVVQLKAKAAFDMLSDEEKLYAYYHSRADWEGAKICLLQCSPESAPIFLLLQTVFSAVPAEEARKRGLASGLTEEECAHALMYSAAVYGNLGNYKNFGDTKFVPSLEPSKFRTFLIGCLAGDEGRQKRASELWKESCVQMYSLKPRQRQMGLGRANGISTYFSANCEEADAELCGKFLESKNLSPYNTRLLKKSDGTYLVKLASSEKTAPSATKDLERHAFAVENGDYSCLMQRVVENLASATQHAANEKQRKMLEHYRASFSSGSIEAHKDGSRAWIQDIGPAVESYIGFIESYRDPSGMRGEWEGFVCAVNKDVSRKFQTLVDNAEDMLKLMPWDSVFEKKVFQRPDFTSLEVLAFGSSGVPAGINIPNYDDIRQGEGFKNVSLGNVLQCAYGSSEKPVTFVREADQALFKQLKGDAFAVQVGVHELLGHGSGRLYHENSAETQEFLARKMADPTVEGSTEVLAGPFYKEGATWDSTFGKIASNYEECRAECCGIYLCMEKAVLEVFGHDAQQGADMSTIHDIAYVNWLLMARSGLVALEFYTPETKAWRQAHMNARYVILRVMLDDAPGLVQLREFTGADGSPDVEIVLDRELIQTVGRRAVGKFLEKLNVYKSLGDFARGSAMFGKYSEVGRKFLQLREVVMARKEPRKLMTQPVMQLSADGKTVGMTEYPETTDGIIQSFVDRFGGEEDMGLWELYLKDKAEMHGSGEDEDGGS